MESGGLLKPMAADALVRRPMQQASVQRKPVRFQDSQKDPEDLRTPVFASKSVQKAEPDDDLDALLCAFVADDDDDEPLEDAVPTDRMPVPVCVPLYDQPHESKRSLWWIWLLLLLFAAAAGYVLWKTGNMPAKLLNKFNIPAWMLDLFS